VSGFFFLPKIKKIENKEIEIDDGKKDTQSIYSNLKLVIE
jgi:hypothetical protein